MAAARQGPTGRTRPLVSQPVAPAQIVAGVLGVTLIAAGLAGLAVDSSFATGADLRSGRLLIFDVNGWHDVVHLATGLLLLGGVGDNRRARSVCRLFGLGYIVVTIAGLAGGDHAFGLIPINAPDDVLHVVLALVALGAAAVSKDWRDSIARHQVVMPDPDGARQVVGPGSGHVGGPRVTQPRVDRRLPHRRHP